MLSTSSSASELSSHGSLLSPDSPTAPEYSSISSVSSDSSQEVLDFLCSEATSRSTLAYPTFKIVGDNLDKHVKPRNMTEDAQASTHHYFHMYGVRDRLDTSHLSDHAPSLDLSELNVDEVLPTEEDYKILRNNFAILISRVLKNRCSFFSKFASSVERHISHMFSDEMSQKSEVVSVGLWFTLCIIYFELCRFLWGF